MATKSTKRTKKPTTGLIEKRPLRESQIAFLSAEASIPRAEIADLTVGDIADRLERHIDPRWFASRKVCGRVVQRDPVTGELRGVPGATVEVQDTDCGGLFRAVGGFQWFYPHICSRETIATAITDECGYFCVWIPRWLIEWVRTWRKERICLPLDRPRLVDVIDFPPIDPDPPIIHDPGWIDPPPEPILVVDPGIDPRMADRAMTLARSLEAGGSRAGLDQMLMTPLSMPPPEPPHDKDLVGYTPDLDAPVDFAHPFGPFWKCRDMWVPEWQTVTDIPDITFRVTQTISGSDVEIYDEGYFEVRWDDSGSGDVTLEANALAVSSDDCDGDTGIVCVDTIGIISASEMPLDQSAVPLFHDDATGYGVRVNRPSASPTEWHPTPSPVANAEAPVADTLVLRGCVHIDGAEFYRIVVDRGSGPSPITGVSWPAWSSALGIITIAPDADGWIEVRHDLVGGYQHLLMKWPTRDYPNASYDATLEVADSAKAVIQQDAGHRFVLDNSEPTFTQFAVRHRVGTGPWGPLILTDCPKIFREPWVSSTEPGEDVVIEVTWRAGAAHLRDASVSMGGCGGSASVSASAEPTRSWYWQASGATDTLTRVATFTIPSNADAGCYTLHRQAVSRAYNPGAPGFSPSSHYWQNEDRRHTRGSWSISIVDE